MNTNTKPLSGAATSNRLHQRRLAKKKQAAREAAALAAEAAQAEAAPEPNEEVRVEVEDLEPSNPDSHPTTTTPERSDAQE